MNRIIALVTVLMLLACSALAESPLSPGAEKAVLALFADGEAGISLQYDEEQLTPAEQYGHSVFVPVGAQPDENGAYETYFMIVPAEIPADHAETLLAEAVGGFGEEAIVSEPAAVESETGMQVMSVSAGEEGTVYRYYTVTDGETVLCITAVFGEDQAGGVGALFDGMAASLAITAPADRTDDDGRFTLVYDPEQLTPAGQYGHCTFVPTGAQPDENGAYETYFMVVTAEIPADQAETLLAEAVGGFGEGAIVSEPAVVESETGMQVMSVSAEEEGTVYRYYTVTDGETVLCITAVFGAEQVGSVGALFDGMAASLAIVGSAAE